MGEHLSNEIETLCMYTDDVIAAYWMNYNNWFVERIEMNWGLKLWKKVYKQDSWIMQVSFHL